jgi:hypothetical protein
MSNRQTFSKETRLNVARVSKAQYFENFRTLPKFSHKEQACINPSPKKLKQAKRERPKDLTLESNLMPIKPRCSSTRAIPHHLVRPPVEKIVVIEKKPERPQSSRPLTFKEKKLLAEEQKRQHEQAKRAAKQKKTLNMLLAAMKQTLFEGKIEGESISPQMLHITVGQAKLAVKERTFVRLVYPLITGLALNIEGTVARKDLDLFVRHFLPKLSDFELAEIATFLSLPRSAE